MQKDTLKQMLAMCDEIRSMSFQVDEAERALSLQKKRVAALASHVSDTSTLAKSCDTKSQELDERLAKLKSTFSLV
jgi:hypothetical protein